MDGAVYEISEWAACQAPNLKQLKANTHTVQYRIVAGKKKQRDNRKDHHDFPSWVVNPLCGLNSFFHRFSGHNLR